MVRDETDNPMRDKWRCSSCGRLNSLLHDNVCPRCMDEALELDEIALTSAYQDNKHAD